MWLVTTARMPSVLLRFRPLLAVTSRCVSRAVRCHKLSTAPSALVGASGRDTLDFTLSAVWHQDRTKGCPHTMVNAR